ncbi:hypothetical protein [Desulfopila aestuarii]|uniref:Uncharacterized protein n=1 Tax=Desulfopila aestuarii DSM 18488 TaxID=1121416 RepID=A0A1M7YJV7_9BACT|nr:hypothetical protein [Desulfopila aestuarii]SHO52892.1 hypothetical protein SAMN02745220_04825 [Desulfopila aestuarii DSM 18488]
MNYKEFFAKISNKDIVIPVDLSSIPKRSHSEVLDNEALFQLPLICLIILTMVGSTRKPIVSQIGQLVGESIQLSMPAFKKSKQHIGWSSNLRVRTVKAITFLERANLIEINNRKGRASITDLGKRVVKYAMDTDSELSQNLAAIRIAYRNICVSNKLKTVL